MGVFNREAAGRTIVEDIGLAGLCIAQCLQTESTQNN